MNCSIPSDKITEQNAALGEQGRCVQCSQYCLSFEMGYVGYGSFVMREGL